MIENKLTHHCRSRCVVQRKGCCGWFPLGGLHGWWTLKALASLFSLSCYMDRAAFLGCWHFTRRWKELNSKADCHFHGEPGTSGSLGLSDYHYFYLDSSKGDLLWHEKALLYSPAWLWQLDSPPYLPHFKILKPQCAKDPATETPGPCSCFLWKQRIWARVLHLANCPQVLLIQINS